MYTIGKVIEYILPGQAWRTAGEIVHRMLNLRNENNNSLLEDFLVAWYVNSWGVITSLGN